MKIEGYLNLRSAFKISFTLILKSTPIKIQIMVIIIMSLLLVIISEKLDKTLIMISSISHIIMSLMAGFIGFFLTSLSLLLSVRLNLRLYQQDNKPSIFDLSLAWYAVTTALSIITLIFSSFVLLIVQLELKVTSQYLYAVMNGVTLGMLSILLFYSLFSVLNLLSSIYNLGRSIAMFKMKEISDAQKN